MAAGSTICVVLRVACIVLAEKSQVTLVPPVPSAPAGRYDLAASMGNRRGIEVQVLNERYAELGQLGIVATERFDLVVHDLGSTTVKGPVAALYGA